MLIKTIPQIIIFDGPDKAGKSTLKAMFDRHTRFNHWTIDRGPLSHLVYNIAYERDEQNHHANHITNIMRQAILIYVTADKEVLAQRIANSPNEPKIDLDRDLNIFKIVLKATLHLWKGGIALDTTVKNPEASLHEIMVKLGQIEEVMSI